MFEPFRPITSVLSPTELSQTSQQAAAEQQASFPEHITAVQSRSLSAASIGVIQPIPDTVIRSLDGEITERRFLLPLPDPRLPQPDSTRGVVDGLILPASTPATSAQSTQPSTHSTTTTTSSFMHDRHISDGNTSGSISGSFPESDGLLTSDASSSTVSRGVSVTSDSSSSSSSKPQHPEKRLMTISFLLELLDDLSSRLPLKPPVIAEDDPDDIYGLVMEEEREKMDEYIDDGKTTVETRKPHTRADSREEDESDSSDIEFLGVSPQGSSSSSSASMADAEPDPQQHRDILGIGSQPTDVAMEESPGEDSRQTLPLERNRIRKIPEDIPNFSGLGSIDEEILKLPSTLVDTFKNFASTVIPLPNQAELEALTEYFRMYILSPFPSPILPGLEVEMKSSILSSQRERMFKNIMRLITMSPCSESACERIFSKARLICGQRKYRMTMETLNARLTVAYTKTLSQEEGK